MQKYSVNQHLIETILSFVKAGDIAIPEIQRPFVWDSSKVRDLMDSLYQGYPIGYVIAWRNPNVRLKDGSLSEGKKILIDGQQRVTALTAAILGEYVVNKTLRPRIKQWAISSDARSDAGFALLLRRRISSRIGWSRGTILLRKNPQNC